MKKSSIEVTCRTCGKEFLVKPSIIKMGEGKYCSQKCSWLSKIKRVKRICENCGKEFETTPSEIRRRGGKYCSRQCYFQGKKGGTKYSQNSDFFEEWNGDVAYILGFIYADGCIRKPRKGQNSNILMIDITDEDLLVAIRDKIAPKRRITVSKRSNEKHPKWKDNYMLHIPDDKMVADLEKLGVHERKTPVKKFPDVPKEYLADFVRGYFDGDGSVFLSPCKNRYPNFVVTIVSGSREFLLSMKEIFKEMKIKSGLTHRPPSTNALRFSSLQAVRFCEFIYSGKSDIKLERKYERYINYLEYRKTYPPKPKGKIKYNRNYNQFPHKHNF